MNPKNEIEYEVMNILLGTYGHNPMHQFVMEKVGALVAREVEKSKPVVAAVSKGKVKSGI